MLEAIDAVFQEIDADGSGTFEYHELKEAICSRRKKVEVHDPMVDRGWNAVQKREAAKDLSARSKSAAIVNGIRLSPDFDLIEQIAAGLATHWGRLSDLFDALDADGGGTVSRREMRQALGQMGLASHPKAVDALFDGMDIDGNGEVTFDELSIAIRASLRAARAVHIQQLNESPRSTDTRLPRIAGLEAVAQQPMFSARPSHSPRNRVGLTRERNSSSQRTLTRAPPPHRVQLMQAPESPRVGAAEAAAQRLRDAFLAIDLDGSGTIGKRELYKALKRIGVEGYSKDMLALYNSVDADRSGQLDWEEFAQLAERLPDLASLGDGGGGGSPGRSSVGGSPGRSRGGSPGLQPSPRLLHGQPSPRSNLPPLSPRGVVAA